MAASGEGNRVTGAAGAGNHYQGREKHTQKAQENQTSIRKKARESVKNAASS